MHLHPDDRMLWDAVHPGRRPLPLADGDRFEVAGTALTVLHTPGHSPGAVCLHAPGIGEHGTLFSGDTLFRGGWGRVDLPGADPEAMVASLDRLSRLDAAVRVHPGHGPDTTIERERPWLAQVGASGSLPA